MYKILYALIFICVLYYILMCVCTGRTDVISHLLGSYGTESILISVYTDEDSVSSVIIDFV
jgi:hypothetical protein